MVSGQSTWQLPPSAETHNVFAEMQIQPGTAGLQQQQEEKAGRTEKTAENARYGQAISEQGFGGETTGNSGSANQGKRHLQYEVFGLDGC